METSALPSIRDYFRLDTLYDADADSWPKHVNAIGLWEYTKDVATYCRRMGRQL